MARGGCERCLLLPPALVPSCCLPVLSNTDPHVSHCIPSAIQPTDQHQLRQHAQAARAQSPRAPNCANAFRKSRWDGRCHERFRFRPVAPSAAAAERLRAQSCRLHRAGSLPNTRLWEQMQCTRAAAAVSVRCFLLLLSLPCRPSFWFPHRQRTCVHELVACD